MKIKLEELKNKLAEGVAKLGYVGEDAQAIIDTLLYAELRGNNQGVPKIATGGVPKSSDVKEFKIVKKQKCGALLSGGNAMASSIKATTMAVELAEAHGVGIVGTNHAHTSSGAIGYYARRIAEAGYIAFVSVGNGSFAAVAPTGSAERKLGTNPLAYAFPYDGGVVVFDTATAAIAYFGVVEAMLKGEPLPEGVALNAKGEPTTDANDILGEDEGESVKGAIKTFAEHKGFGLSLFVQLLGSAFTLGALPCSNQEDGAGTFVLAIDPGLLAGKEEYMKRSQELVKHIKSSKPIEGQHVLLPGEHGDAKVKQIVESGEIEIADGIWNELISFIKE